MMLVQTREFVDVAARSRELGCRVPVELALLPGNFPTAADVGEFVFHPAAQHIRSAWQNVGLVDEGRDSESGTSAGIPTPDPSPSPLVPSAAAKVPLVAFFGSGLLTGPEWSLAVALGLVSRVLALHPACASPWEVQFDAVVERPSGGYASIEYLGDAYGLIALAREVRLVWAGK